MKAEMFEDSDCSDDDENVNSSEGCYQSFFLRTPKQKESLDSASNRRHKLH